MKKIFSTLADVRATPVGPKNQTTLSLNFNDPWMRDSEFVRRLGFAHPDELWFATMPDLDRRAALILLLETIGECDEGIVNLEGSDKRRQQAVAELEAEFGESIRQHPAIKTGRVFFTLTGSGQEFRCWHTPFFTWERECPDFRGKSPEHFDSGGFPYIFEAHSKDVNFLRSWIEPFVADLYAWTRVVDSLPSTAIPATIFMGAING